MPRKNKKNDQSKRENNDNYCLEENKQHISDAMTSNEIPQNPQSLSPVRDTQRIDLPEESKKEVKMK